MIYKVATIQDGAGFRNHPQFFLAIERSTILGKSTNFLWQFSIAMPIHRMLRYLNTRFNPCPYSDRTIYPFTHIIHQPESRLSLMDADIC